MGLEGALKQFKPATMAYMKIFGGKILCHQSLCPQYHALRRTKKQKKESRFSSAVNLQAPPPPQSLSSSLLRSAPPHPEIASAPLAFLPPSPASPRRRGKGPRPPPPSPLPRSLLPARAQLLEFPVVCFKYAVAISFSQNLSHLIR